MHYKNKKIRCSAVFKELPHLNCRKNNPIKCRTSFDIVTANNKSYLCIKTKKFSAFVFHLRKSPIIFTDFYCDKMRAILAQFDLQQRSILVLVTKIRFPQKVESFIFNWWLTCIVWGTATTLRISSVLETKPW